MVYDSANNDSQHHVETSRSSQKGMKAAEFTDAIILAAANPWDGITMADQQLAQSLARHAPVIYVDPPQSFMTRYRESGVLRLSHGPRVERLGNGFLRVTPEGLPGLSRPVIASINRRLIARQVGHVLHDVGGTPGTVIEANILTPIMGLCGERQRVYWAQDDFAGMASLVGKSRKAYVKSEALLVKQADHIIAANPQVAEALRRNGRSVDLIPFGCDYTVFSRAQSVHPAPEVNLPGPIAVFMGHIGDRIDLAMLQAVATSGISILLVGPRHPRTDMEKFQFLLDMENVQWVKGQPFHELPSYLAHGTVGLLPYNMSDFNLGSFPLKTLEYLAAGLPVVATRLPAMSILDTPHIHLAGSPREFANLVCELLSKGRDKEGDNERRSFAAQHTWDKRADAFAEVLGVDIEVHR